MKRIILLFTLLLMGCDNLSGASYQVGECYRDRDGIYIITKVGEYSLIMRNIEDKTYIIAKEYNNLRRVDCFNFFDNKIKDCKKKRK